MLNLDDDSKIENFVLDLSVQAKRSEIHPISRNLINFYLPDILNADPEKFVYYNIKWGSDLYCTYLFACLPEVWVKINMERLLDLSDEFTSPLSYYTLIKFTYKYIEIDIIKMILERKKLSGNRGLTDAILNFLERQWNLLVKSEADLEDFEDGTVDVKYDDWMDVKHRFVHLFNIPEGYTTAFEVRQYITDLLSEYEN